MNVYAGTLMIPVHIHAPSALDAMIVARNDARLMKTLLHNSGADTNADSSREAHAAVVLEPTYEDDIPF